MDKEQLIKLAVVAGVAEHDCQLRTYSDGRVELSIPDPSNPFAGRSSRIWQPHEDIAQAFEVLEGWDYSGMKMLKSVPILVSISRCVQTETNFLQDEYEAKGETLPEAICKAVLKATEQGNG